MQHKICRGPFHPPGGELIPLSEFTTYKSGPKAGKPLSRCKKCRNLGNASTFPAEVFMPLLVVLKSERSIKEVSQLTNISEQQIKDLLSGKRKRVYKKTYLNIYRAFKDLPKEKVSIGPKNIKTKRNGLKKLSYEERLTLKELVSAAQKERYKKDKQLLKY
jgi:hypothetical protein